MRKATRIVATVFGVLAGIAGLGHGVTEILQGDIRPPSFMFASIGDPCIPEKAWHACEPAMTLLPNLLLAGILAVVFSLLMIIWSAAFLPRKNGGSVLILVSVILLLVGGGVADGNHDARAGGLLDETRHARQFGRDGDQLDAPACGFLKLLELIP